MAGALCAVAACGGGAGGSPTSAAPSTPPNVAGTYDGTLIFTSATPDTHCFSRGLATGRGHGLRYTVTVQQAGSQISGTLDNTDMRITCAFTGSVAGDGSVRWSQTSCTDASRRSPGPRFPACYGSPRPRMPSKVAAA